MAQLPQDPNAAAQAAPGAAPQQAPSGGGGGAKDLLMNAHDAMSKLADAMGQSGAVDDDDIQMAQQIVAQIEALGDSLGGAKGGAGGPVPEQAGAAKVSQAMYSMVTENHLTSDTPTGDTSGVDADALLEKIESGQEVTQETQPTTTTTGPTQTQQAPTPTVDEYEFTWNGKQIKANREKVLQWANQGYDYAQKMSDYNKRNTEIERIKQELIKTYEPYEQINKYAQKNPDWWNHVVNQYENRSIQTTNQPQGGEIPRAVLEKLESLENFKSQFEEKISAEQREREDQALGQEVQSIRKQYPNLDFDTPDSEGFSLEQRVMKHAVDNGINSFRAAFRDLRHDDLLKLAQEKAKEETAKTLQSRTKQGIMGTSSSPKTGLGRAENVKSKSWDDLKDEALKELGIVAS